MTADLTEDKGASTDEHGRGKDHLVKVEINGTTKEIPRGKYTGATLKVALGVPPSDELDLIVKGEFRPIGDAQEIKINGGEKFVSHVGQGASS